mgnify:CR=1 FL=1
MIYISSSGIKKKKISKIVRFLVSKGFKNIELSGGSKYYNNIEEDLILLKKKYNLNLQLHNYFPPPKKDFVINLSSNNDKIFLNSIDHYKKSINLSKKLGSNKFALHAGYLIDPDVSELGKKLKKRIFIKKNVGIKRFKEGFEILKDFAGKDFEIYVENNVISKKNYKNFSLKNPLLFTDFKSYLELRKKLNFKILLDVAHLKVSCNSLGLNFEEEFNKFIKHTNYLHISGNDGTSDSNKSICSDKILKRILKKKNFKNKVLTLEIYTGIKDIIKSYKYINSLYE